MRLQHLSRVTSLLLCASLVAGSLAACAPSTPSSTTTTASSSDTTTAVVSKPTVPANELHVFATVKDVPTDKEYNPYFTITDAVANAKAGDVVLVHAGTYRETLTINTSDISIENYEEDEVYVTGTELLTGWTDAPDMEGVKVAQLLPMEGSLQFTQVFTNHTADDNTMARFPNRTIDSNMAPLDEGGGYGFVEDIYKDADNTSGYVTFTKDDVPDVNLTGAIFKGLIGKNREYPMGYVTSVKDNTVGVESLRGNNWTYDDGGTVAEGYHLFGYACIMHKNLIDIPGEWFAEDKENKLYYMPTGDVESDIIEMQVREKVLVMNDAENVTMDGIRFYGGNAQLNNTNGLAMSNCEFQYLYPFSLRTDSYYPTGVYLNKCSNNTFDSVYLAHTWGNGFFISGGESNTFDNCYVKDIGWIGYFTASMMVQGKDTLIQHCTFEDSGRFQIRFDIDGKIQILDNEFSGAMSMGEDAGAIQMTSSGKIGALDLDGTVIAYNVIHDIKGVPVSGGNEYLKAFVKALYLEDVQNYTAHHNLIYNISSTIDPAMREEYPGLITDGGLLYLGPRYNAMDLPVNIYNNTAYGYDKNVNIWHVAINNLDELHEQGITQQEASGTMTNVHFANNALESVPFSVFSVKQNLKKNGGKMGNVPDTFIDGFEGEFATFEEYLDFLAPLEAYDFKLDNNVYFDATTAAENYNDLDALDFSLKADSALVDGGVAIDGITADGDATPDIGAFEGGDRVLEAGSSLAK